MVYKLVDGYAKEGAGFLMDKKVGRPCTPPCGAFSEKVIALRKESDYGSEKLHFVLKKEGFAVSQRQIQKVLDLNGLTEPCEKRRGQRKYVRYQWPISNYMWHCDWSEHEGKWYIAFIDDRSRKIMAAGCFANATEDNVIFLLYQAILTHGVCPVIVLSDKGTQFYNSKPNKKGELTPSRFEQELTMLGIEFWTSRRNHPQTNGKMEKWFDTLKKRIHRHPEETLQGFVQWYNEKRIHHALAYGTPERIYQENL
jgi:putative transposase